MGMTIEQKVLLSLSRTKNGLTWGIVSTMKGMSASNAYNTLMSLRRRGLAKRCLSTVRGRHKNYRFFITDAGRNKLHPLPEETKK